MWLFRRKEGTGRGAPTESATKESDEQAILDMLVPRAQARIDGQLRDSDAVDSKAFGVLAVDTAAIALVVAVRDDVNSLWWIPTAALGMAGILLLATVWPRTFDVGPDPRSFYEAMGASTQLEAARQMLSELLEAVDGSDKQLPRKNRFFKAGFALIVMALLGSLAVGLVR